MPDDRELADTGASGRLLADQVPGLAAVDELVVSRQSEALDSDDILVRKPLGFLFWLASGWVGLVVLLAVLANLLPLPNPDFQNYGAINAPPSVHHLLGTDDLGRDLLSRLIYGARVSLIVGFVLGGHRACWSAAPWAGLGLQGRPARHRPQRRILRAPGLPGHRGRHRHRGLLGPVAVSRSPSSWASPPSPSSTGWCGPRACRSPTATSSSPPGPSAPPRTRIVFREILPNVVPVAITFGLITVAGVIVIEGSLAFLGLSVPPPTPSWGNIISEGTSNGNLNTNPYIMLWPVLAMFLLLLSINLIGDRMRQRFDIREGLL